MPVDLNQGSFPFTGHWPCLEIILIVTKIVGRDTAGFQWIKDEILLNLPQCTEQFFPSKNYPTQILIASWLKNLLYIIAW